MDPVKEVPTPQEYINFQYLERIDFHDTFSTSNHQHTIEEITKLIFDNPSNWIKRLFALRNILVSLIGLKTEIPKDYNKSFAVGGYIGFFKIFSISETQLILGANDSHLNFRAIVTKGAELSFNIKVITLVQFNNSIGKVYMHIIGPFHRLVVKRLVKNAFRS